MAHRRGQWPMTRPFTPGMHNTCTGCSPVRTARRSTRPPTTTAPGTWPRLPASPLFTGDTATARTLALEGKNKMDHQIESDGKMPEELARTNGLGYSTYNLQAL